MDFTQEQLDQYIEEHGIVPIFTETDVVEIIKDDLTGGQIVNLELDDTTIKRNIKRAISYMSMYYTGLSYVTKSLVSTTKSGGYLNLTDIDPGGVNVIYAVYPMEGLLQTDSGLLGLGHIYLSIGAALDNQMTTYANMISKLSLLDSILGKNARVVGDKLYVDKYYGRVTIAYVPKTLTVETIQDGEWLRWVIEYAGALSKRQVATARGKYVVQSSPSQPNAPELLSDANETINRLEEEIKTKGLLIPTRG